MHTSSSYDQKSGNAFFSCFYLFATAPTSYFRFCFKFCIKYIMCKSSAEPLRQQRNENRQSNNNKNIDQSTGAAWLQFNWASFGSGISSILIILALLVLLFVCYKKNKRATRKARRAELHELVTLATRGRRQSTSTSSPSATSSGYPGPRSTSANAGGFPATLPHICGSSMQQFYPGTATFSSGIGSSPFSPASPTVHFPGLHLSGLPGINYNPPTPQAIGFLPREDWTRIQELPRPTTPARPRGVTYSRDAPEEIQPEPILRRGPRRSSLRSSGISRSTSVQDLQDVPAPQERFRTGAACLGGDYDEETRC